MDTKTTLNSELSSADLCRANGWKVGRVLQGTDGQGKTCDILIVVVGEDEVIARCLTCKRKHNSDVWDLTFREWKAVEDLAPIPMRVGP